MKKIVALFLTVALLLGVLGTSASAAEAAALTIPEFSASVAADGSVTVTVSGGKAYSYAEAYVRNSDDSYGDWVWLTWDEGKKAYVGKEEELAGGKMGSLNMYANTYKYNDDNTEETFDRNDFYASYSNGKLYYVSVSVSKGSEKQLKYTYTDSEGNQKTSSSMVTVESKGEQVVAYYDTDTGKKTTETHYNTEEKGDGKKSVTRKETRDEKSYDNETGALTGITTGEGERTFEYVPSKWGWLDERTKTSKDKSETKNYDEDGKYTGKSLHQSEYTYDPTDLDSYEAVKGQYSHASYNKKDILTYEYSEEYTNTYNSAKDQKTYTGKTNNINYSSKGLKTSSSQSTVSRNYKREKYSDGSWMSWEQTSRKEENNNFNRDDVLTGSSVYEYTYGDKYAYTRTNRSYNAYTRQMTSETISKTRENDEGNYEYYSSQTYNNDNGTLRRKTVNDFDGTITRYNKDNKVVATKDKDGTWKDGSGKVIGKNENKDGNGQYTYVYFKSRTGEIDRINIENHTQKDGESVYTDSYYDENGKLTSEYKYVNKADGTYERYENGVLRYSEKDNERKYYDYKGNLDYYSKYDEEKKETTWYDYADRKTSMDGPDYGESYDRNGKVVSSWKYKDGLTSYYDGKSQLLYSEGYDEDGAQVYYGKDGKEFARVYSKRETKDDVTTETRERIYGEEYDYGDGYSYTDYEYWDPEDNSGTLEKSVAKREEKDKDGVYTTSSSTDYTKWDVIEGKKQNEVTRKETSSSVDDDEHYESKTYKDGVLTYSYDVEKNEYGDWVKGTTRYFDAYTGKQTSASKWINPGIPDDPISYSKSYDKYDNLQSYSETDDTDEWNWTKSYYANGNKYGESWYDNLDGDESYNISYYLNGNPSYESTEKDGVRKEINYNPNGTYSYWRETANGVTNITEYNGQGTVTGYTWNEKSEDGFYSYERWDANNLLYTYTSESLADGWTETKVDPAGNKQVWKDGEYTLTLANNATSGWQSAFGDWFYLENGKPVQGAWRQLGGSWYYFNYDGSMRMGLLAQSSKDGTKTYALSKDGVLSTGGWTEMGENYWAYTDQNGEVLTGWQQIGGYWYYFDDGWTYNKTEYKQEASWSQSGWKGSMVTGAVQIWNSDWTDKHTYFFNEDGTWDNTPGWKTAQVDGRVEYHYYDQNKNEVTGWKQIDGKWYFFNDDGVLKNGWVGSGNTWYYLDPANGSAMATGWAQEVYEDWYYLNEDGTMKTGWLEDGGNWYYLKDSGAMASDEWVTSGSSTYYMTEAGTMASGWAEDNGEWYYLDPNSGAMTTGWVQSGDTWYYMDPATGAMVSDGEVEVNGTTYKFDANGAWIP